MAKSILLLITNCQRCPNCTTERTRGAGCASDFLCKAVKDPSADYGFKVIRGYVEWGSQAPKDGEIPDWCPFISEEDRQR